MIIIEIIKAIFYGFIEGVTEWLPISSTGHLILFENFFGFTAGKEFMEMFRVVIQLGAIFAVIILYFHKLNPFSQRKTLRQKQSTWSLWFKVLIACVPAGIIGILFDDELDKAFYNFPSVAVMLIIYGVGFIVIENLIKRGKIKTSITSFNQLSYKTALIIGVFQLLSLIPGTSRSGVTILGAILICCSREIAAEFSFFLAIPVMFGASLLKCAKYAMSIADGETIIGFTEIVVLFVGIVVSFIVSVFAIKFLVGFIKKNNFVLFGWYRIVLGIVLIAYFTMTLVR